MPVPLPDDQAQALLLTETGGAADPVAVALMPEWWLLYAPKEADGAGLQYWYTRRAVLDYLLRGLAATALTVKIGDDQVSGKDKFAATASLRAEANAEILKIEGLTRSGLVSLSAQSALPSAYADYLTAIAEW